MLTPHQEEKKAEIIALLKKGHKRIILQGSAGVGKTYLVGELVKELVRDHSINPFYNNGIVYINAPTNKALSILQNKIEPHRRIEFKTVHSALSMKMYTDGKTGQRKFVRAWSRPDKEKDFNKCKIALIDECSMLNTEFVGGYVYNPQTKEREAVEGFLEPLPFPIIYIGDNKQLNPVGEPGVSPVFQHNYPVVELTEIIRQGEGNPIIDLSRNIDLLWFKIPKLVDGFGYIFDNNKAAIIDDLAEVNGTDELKYLSYMNTDLDALNHLVRQTIYGESPRRIEPKEVVVFNAPYGPNYTNKELKVEDLDIVIDYVGVPTAKTKWVDDEPTNLDKLKLKYYMINESVKIIHEDSESMYKKVIHDIEQNCKNYGWNWKGKYYFAEHFADIKYNHAISIHKSQGSTYKETILNIENIDRNRNVEEKQRLLYTGITRASNLLKLNNVK